MQHILVYAAPYPPTNRVVGFQCRRYKLDSYITNIDKYLSVA